MSKQAQENPLQETKAAKKENIIITFIAPYQRYANGDVAGFDAEKAKNILAIKPTVAKAYQANSTDSFEPTE